MAGRCKNFMPDQILNAVRRSNSPRTAIYEIEKLQSLLNEARITMLTSIDQDGNLRSRPMTLQEIDNDGCCWFLADSKTSTVSEIRDIARVNISLTHEESYVSISGRAAIMVDRKKAEQLWRPEYKIWFPEGLEDSDLVLLRVSIDYAEYWDQPGGAVNTLIGFVKTLITGKNPESRDRRGDHAKYTVFRGPFNWGPAAPW